VGNPGMLMKNAPKDAPWNAAQKSGVHNANVAAETMNLPIQVKNVPKAAHKRVAQTNVAANVHAVKRKNPLMQIENAPKDAQESAAPINVVYNAPLVMMMMKKLSRNI